MAKTLGELVAIHSKGIEAVSARDKLVAFTEFATVYDPTNSEYDTVTTAALDKPREEVMMAIGREAFNYLKGAYTGPDNREKFQKLVDYDDSVDLSRDLTGFLFQKNGHPSFYDLIDRFDTAAEAANTKTDNVDKHIAVIRIGEEVDDHDDIDEGVARAAQRYLREKIMEGITVDEIASPLTGKTIELGAAIVSEFSKQGYHDPAVSDSLTMVLDYLVSQVPKDFDFKVASDDGSLNYDNIRSLARFSIAADNLKICKDRLTENTSRSFFVDQNTVGRINQLQGHVDAVYSIVKANVGIMLDTIQEQMVNNAFDNPDQARTLLQTLETHIDNLEFKTPTDKTPGRLGMFNDAQVAGYKTTLEGVTEILDGKTVTQEYETITGRYNITTNKQLDPRTVEIMLAEIEEYQPLTKEKKEITFANSNLNVVGIVRRIGDKEYTIDREALEEFTTTMTNCMRFGANITMPGYFPQEVIPVGTDFNGFKNAKEESDETINPKTGKPYTLKESLDEMFGEASKPQRKQKQPKKSKRNIGAYVGAGFVAAFVAGTIVHNHYATERLDAAQDALCSPQGTLEVVELSKGMEPEIYQTDFKDGVAYVTMKKTAETNHRTGTTEIKYSGGTMQVSKAGWQFFGNNRNLSRVLDDQSCLTSVNEKLHAAQAVYRGQVK